MLDIKIDIVGLKEIERYLKNISKLIDKRINAFEHDIGKIVVKKAKQYAPKDSGTLENAIQYQIQGKGNVEIFVPISGKAGKYAYYVHENKYKKGKGTRRKGSKSGNKFIGRAIKDSENDIEKEMNEIFRGI